MFSNDAPQSRTVTRWGTDHALTRSPACVRPNDAHARQGARDDRLLRHRRSDLRRRRGGPERRTRNEREERRGRGWPYEDDAEPKPPSGPRAEDKGDERWEAWRDLPAVVTRASSGPRTEDKETSGGQKGDLPAVVTRAPSGPRAEDKETSGGRRRGDAGEGGDGVHPGGPLDDPGAPPIHPEARPSWKARAWTEFQETETPRRSAPLRSGVR